MMATMGPLTGLLPGWYCVQTLRGKTPLRTGAPLFADFVLLVVAFVWGTTFIVVKQAIAEELLGPLFGQLKAGIASQIEQLTAEGDIVVAQTSGTAETIDGTPYNNSYCQVIRIRDGRIAAVKEYMDTALIDSVFGAA